MERVYELSGDANELSQCIQAAFDFDETEARFITKAMTYEKMSDKTQTEDESMWDMEEQPKYSTPIFRTRVNISFSDASVHFFRNLFSYFANYFHNQDQSTISFLLDNVIDLISCINYIKNNECCVYFAALDWSKDSNSKWFHVEDLKFGDIENCCSNLDHQDWECRFCHEEQCGITKQSVTEILDRLCKKHVFREHDGLYAFRR